MKKGLSYYAILALVIASVAIACSTLSGCTATKKGSGCYGTRGYSGY